MSDNKSVREIIDEKLSQDEAFCAGISKCETREDAIVFLESNNIKPSEEDMNYLAEKIFQASEMCSELSEEDMEKISGGADIPAEKVAIGVGIAATAILSIGLIKSGIDKIQKKMKKKLWWSPFK